MSKVRGLNRRSLYRTDMYDHAHGKCEVLVGKKISWHKRKKLVEKIKTREELQKPKIKGQPIIFYGMKNI